MLDIKYIREHSAEVQAGLRAKKSSVDVDQIIALDVQRREVLSRVEKRRAEKNALSDTIAKADAAQKKELIASMKAGESAEKADADHLQTLTKQLDALLMDAPNIPAADVKVGVSEEENEMLETFGFLPSGAYGKGGAPKAVSFSLKDATALGEALDIIDTERAGKVSGSRFGYLKGGAALLEFALVQYTMHTLVHDGFTPVIPPVLVKPEIMQGMGYLGHGGEDETYHFIKGEDEAYLVGTSEQSVVPMHTGETLTTTDDAPIRYVAFSTCFRREAGSYGKDTRGILRVHQFDKIEMVSFTHPSKSDEEHLFLRSMEEKLVQGLQLPYRVIKQCTGDLSDPAARTFDIETWMPGQQCYRETHSTSNTTDFQARRLNIKWKGTDGVTSYAHILNGTAFALGRILIAIIENYQQADGSILIPEALRTFLPAGMSHIKPHA